MKKNNIFTYLNDTTIPLAKKEQLVNKKQKKIEKIIKTLSYKELFEYLFNSKLPVSCKELIATEIDELCNSYNDIKIEKYNKIHILFASNIKTSEKYLVKSYIPKCFKSDIIKTLYKYDAIEKLSSKTISKAVKKAIIDVEINRYNAGRILSKIKDEKTFNYVLELIGNDEEYIKNILCEEKISYEIKLDIIDKYINNKNILYFFDSTNIPAKIKDKIIEMKRSELDSYLNNLKESKLISLLYKRLYEPIFDLLIETKLDKIIKKLRFKSIGDYAYYLEDIKSKKLASIILERMPIKRKLSLYLTPSSSILKMIKNNNLPIELKENLFNKNKYRIGLFLKRSLTEVVLYDYLSENSNIPEHIQKYIFNIKKDKIIKFFNENDEKENLDKLRYTNYIPSVKRLLVQSLVNENNIVTILNKNEDEVGFILESKNNILENILNKMTPDEILNMQLFRTSAIENQVIKKNKNIIKNKLNRIDKSILIHELKTKSIRKERKKIMFNILGIKDKDLDSAIRLSDLIEIEQLLKVFYSIKKVIENSNIELDLFIQYGLGSTIHKEWLADLIKIFDENKQEDFVKVKNYLFENMYHEELQKENSVSMIKCFLEILDNFNTNYELLISLANENVLLDDQSINNLEYLFNVERSKKNKVKKLQDIEELRKELSKEEINLINNSLNLERLREIFKKQLLCNSDKTLELIGGTRTLITLKENNKESKALVKEIDSLIVFSKVIELVNYTNNIEGLRKVLQYFIIDNPNNLMKIQNEFSKYKERVKILFELDAEANFSKTHNARNLGLIDAELSKRYKGEVFDYSNANYYLYAHVLSNNEKIEDLVNGKSSGSKNFISVSAISYMGQKYYYDRCETILAYDKIPKGSFICSSITNMGTNYNVNKYSSEVPEIKREQRGILETSAVTKANSEILLYREGLVPCGLILPDGREPARKEMEIHTKYNLPFIITQNMCAAIEKPEKIFKLNEVNIKEESEQKINDIIIMLSNTIATNKQSEIYTGKEIALITDIHALREPTLAVLEDIRRHEITEIYSLGDNIGDGPNPREVLDLLDKYNCVSIAGNSEYYNILGTEPFSYLDNDRKENQEWTYNSLTDIQINDMKLLHPSKDLFIGDKKIALCHFANDIRFDFSDNSTWQYQTKFSPGVSSKQLLYTNSKDANNHIKEHIANSDRKNPSIKGYLSAEKEPLFEGKQITSYDAIIQGHVHFELDDYYDLTKIYTLRALGMGYAKEEKNNEACYYVLKEKNDGSFDIEKRYVSFNKSMLLSEIESSGMPHKERVLRFVKV